MSFASESRTACAASCVLGITYMDPVGEVMIELQSCRSSSTIFKRWSLCTAVFCTRSSSTTFLSESLVASSTRSSGRSDEATATCNLCGNENIFLKSRRSTRWRCLKMFELNISQMQNALYNVKYHGTFPLVHTEAAEAFYQLAKHLPRKSV